MSLSKIFKNFNYSAMACIVLFCT